MKSPRSPLQRRAHRPSLKRAVGGALAIILLAGVTMGGCAEAVPPLTDDEIREQWVDIPEQCMGFADEAKTVYRSPGDDPNPKEGESCSTSGGTADGGHCNVPCGYSDLEGPIGNKNCECASGFFANCACDPLPSYAERIPQFVGSCEDEEGAPTEWDGEFVDAMSGVACDEELDACITPDLPLVDDELGCLWTTPKGCLCVANRWQCASSNGWFTCLGDDCPQSFKEAGVINGNIKLSQHCTSN